MTIKQEDIDQLQQKYRQKKREVERGLCEMRAIRKQIDLWEDFMIIEALKSRENPKRELL